MELIFIAIVVAAILIAAIKPTRKNRYKYNPNEAWPYKEKRLLTAIEERLFFRLKEALPNHHIFVQVQLSQLVEIKKSHDFQKWFNRINRMSADFVVADEKLKTLAVIELDDSSHNRPDRIEADQKKDKALLSAGIRVIRWKTKHMPSTEEIRAEIAPSDTENTQYGEIRAI